MSEMFSRTEMLLGKDAIKTLQNSRVAVFGIGGVGGHAMEALIRSGIGEIDIIDNDKVIESNLNRQIIATQKTVGEYKVDAAEQRILDINPDVIIHKHKTFFTSETSETFDFSKYDYVIDAIDTVSGKIELVMKCKEHNTPIICSMGAGNKMNPTEFQVEDIYKTSVCPLAKVMRQELRKRNIKSLKVVYSQESPIKQATANEGKHVPASNAFVPSVVGLIIASEVVKDLVKSRH